jgi:hypothetical protein
MLLAGLEIRVKAAEEKVVKRSRAIVVERAQISRLEAELAERQEDERRHELLQLVTRYRAKVGLSSAEPEKKAVQKLLLNDVCPPFFHTKQRWTVLILRHRSSGLTVHRTWHVYLSSSSSY